MNVKELWSGLNGWQVAALLIVVAAAVLLLERLPDDRWDDLMYVTLAVFGLGTGGLALGGPIMKRPNKRTPAPPTDTNAPKGR